MLSSDLKRAPDPKVQGPGLVYWRAPGDTLGTASSPELAKSPPLTLLPPAPRHTRHRHVDIGTEGLPCKRTGEDGQYRYEMSLGLPGRPSLLPWLQGLQSC